MKKFEPRLYQQEMINRAKSGKGIPPLYWGRPRFVGIDVAQKDGDKTVVVQGIVGENGGHTIISIDEYATFPEYKWYRNPIRWWKLRRVMEMLEKRSSDYAQFGVSPVQQSNSINGGAPHDSTKNN